MRKRTLLVLVGSAGVVAPLHAGEPPIGADAIVRDISSAAYFGQSGGIAAYAFGPTTCNTGDAPILYTANTNQHPLWAMNLYRLKDGIFMQVGMSHLANGFFALAQNVCGACGGSNGSTLPPGCSDVSTASISGAQNLLTPRWQVNPYTGAFAFPGMNTPFEATTGRRLQVRVEDVNPAQNPNATYFAEMQVISPDDALPGNGDDNVSSRNIEFTPELQPFFVQPTQLTLPAVRRWATFDGGVQISEFSTTDDGGYVVASRARDNGDGTWLYVYAIFNRNNDHAARAFELDLGSGSVVDPGFHSPFYHSNDGINGLVFSSDPWVFSAQDGIVRWETETFDFNPNANALRWGTTYSFWFTSTREPMASTGSITLFKPSANPVYDAIDLVKPRLCLGDIDNGGTVDFGDLNQILAGFGQSGEDLPADIDHSGTVDFGDLNATLTEFGRSCS